MGVLPLDLILTPILANTEPLLMAKAKDMLVISETQRLEKMVWLNLISKTPWFLCKVQFAEVMCDTMKKNEKSTLLLVLLKYSVKSTLHSHSVVISKLFPHDFLTKIPSKCFFTKKLYYKLISRKFFEVGVNLHIVEK